MKPWGAYAPPRQARFLRRLIAVGLGRGRLRKAILRRWARRFGPWVDIERGQIGWRLNIRDNTTDGKILACHRSPDRIEVEALAEHCRGGLFIDIGANTGYYALSLARAGADKVIAIEPHPAARERLRFHVRLNSAQEVVSVLPMAVGPKGAAWLFSRFGDLGSSSLHWQSDPETPTRVSVRPLAWILRVLRIEQVAGLKIDVEGFEDRVLIPFFTTVPRSLWPACLVLETAHRKLWEQDAIAHLLDCGYRVLKTTRENRVLRLQGP
ncbi:MAG: FkbM family methyltransferase [Gammaproteobacteria bacterium]|nr:FkbM family methyltransferase [Gammaproteobacteria bacterium]MDE0414013.1 FkbM family methyltransferase [Gammaproteobacteria bacterium]